jgi:hypothetical protein
MTAKIDRCGNSTLSVGVVIVDEIRRRIDAVVN